MVFQNTEMSLLEKLTDGVQGPVLLTEINLTPSMDE